MHKLLITCAATCLFAAPAAAQPDAYGPDRALPSGEEIEDMAPALDRMTGALLDIDVGAIIDAADPYARRRGYGRPGRTIGAIARARDPEFDARWRGAIYGGTAQAARMVDAFAAAMPALRQSLDQARAAIEGAVEDYHRQAPRGRSFRRD